MPEDAPSQALLIVLLIAYGGGIIWVLGLLWVTIMKFSGWITIERPAWLFGSVQRATGICMFSLIMLVVFDRVVRLAGWL